MNPAEGISQVAGFIGVLWSENVKPDSPALKPEPLSADQIVILEVGGEKRGVSKSHSHAAVKARAPSLGASPMVATGVSRYDDLSSASTNARNGSDGSIASPGRLAQPSKAIGDLGAYLAFTEARRLPSMCRPEKLSSGRGQFSLGSPHAQLAASPLKSEASEVDDALSSIGSNLDNEFVTKLLGDPSTTPILKSLLEFPSLRPNAGGRRRSLLLAGDTSKTMPDLRGGPAERPEAGEGSPIIESHTQRCRRISTLQQEASSDEDRGMTGRRKGSILRGARVNSSESGVDTPVSALGAAEDKQFESIASVASVTFEQNACSLRRGSLGSAPAEPRPPPQPPQRGRVARQLDPQRLRPRSQLPQHPGKGFLHHP